MTNVGRLHDSRVIFVMANVFLPLELANDFQWLEAMSSMIQLACIEY